MAVATDVVLPAGKLRRIHVNQYKIKNYHKTGVDEPAWIIRTSDGVYYCRHWSVDWKATMDSLPPEQWDEAFHGVQRLAKPMPGCSARLWIETRAALKLEQAEWAESVCGVAA